MELVIGIVVVLLVLLYFYSRRSGTRQVELNYLIPDADEVPLQPFQCNAAGINKPSRTGGDRQDNIAKLKRGQQVHLIREPDNPHDPQAVALFTSTGKDIGYLPAEIAAEIAPRLDKKSPVTAVVLGVERFKTEKGKNLLGVRLELTKYQMKRGGQHERNRDRHS